MQGTPDGARHLSGDFLLGAGLVLGALVLLLDRRIADVMRVPKLTGRLRELGEKLPSPLRFMRAIRQTRDAAAG